MEAPFPHFKPSSAEGPREFRLTQYNVLIPLYISLVLMAAQPETPGPGLWFVMSFSLGLNILFYGIERLCFEKNVCTTWAARLAECCNDWLPWVVFGARCTSIALTVGMFWVFAVNHGVPGTIWQNINVAALVASFFAYQFIRAVAVSTENETWQSAAELARYAGITLAALLVAGIITLSVAPPSQRIPSELHFFIVALWVVVAMVPIVCALLWASHVISRRETAQR